MSYAQADDSGEFSDSDFGMDGKVGGKVCFIGFNA